MLDCLFTGGTVVDGTGAAAYRGDVGIAGDRLVMGSELAACGGAGAYRTIDVNGLVICPGFIDMHAHADLPLIREPSAIGALAQGVTCQVLGQDGLSYAPVTDAILPDLHARIRGWNGPLPDGGISWRSVRDYLACLDGAAVNAAYLAPHGTLRLAVLGMAERPASRSEVEQMGQALELALCEGAVGLSTGLTYVPASHADTAELTELCRVVAAHGGYFAPHHRSYGAGAVEAYDECIDIARRSGVALHLTHAHLSFPVNKNAAPRLLSLVDGAIAEGVDVTLDSYPYVAGSSYLHALLPSWVQAGSVDAVVARLRDPQTRKELREPLEVSGCDGSHGVPVNWTTVVISGVNEPANADAIGLSVAELAIRRGEDPLTTYCDLLVSEHLGATCLVFAGHESNVRAILRHPAQMAGSDALLVGERPHPRAYGTFARYLGWAVREEQLVSLEEMVRKMTSAPARRLRLSGRGVLTTGAAADVVCFDPATVRDWATYEEPRLFPEGIPYVMVNGALAIDDHRPTGSRTGRALRPERGLGERESWTQN